MDVPVAKSNPASLVYSLASIDVVQTILWQNSPVDSAVYAMTQTEPSVGPSYGAWRDLATGFFRRGLGLFVVTQFQISFSYRPANSRA